VKNYCPNQYDVSKDVRYFHTDRKVNDSKAFSGSPHKLKNKSMKTKKTKKDGSPESKKKTAVLYTRVAVKQVKHRKNSCIGQEEELRKYCKKKKIKVIRVIHETFSGKHFDRPEFRKFLNDLNAGKIKPDLLLCTTWDRFARGYGDAFIMMANLEKLNVKVAAIKYSNQNLIKN